MFISLNTVKLYFNSTSEHQMNSLHFALLVIDTFNQTGEKKIIK